MIGKHDFYNLFIFRITTFNKKILNKQEREREKLKLKKS